MSAKKIIDSTICWAKNKSNCVNVLSFIIFVNKKKKTTTMRNKTFTRFDLFLTQQCSSIYNLSLIVITTHASCC
jgi:hypothetical protein